MFRHRGLLVAAAATLLALAAAALLALAPAAAEPPPGDLALRLAVDDSDGVLEPGQTFTVSAELTWTGSRDPLGPQLQIGGGSVRIRGTEHVEFDIGRRSLRLPAFSAPDARSVVSFTPIDIRDADGNEPSGRARANIRALDGRTALVYRAPGPSSAPARLYVYDLYNQRQSITINAPTGAHSDFAISPRGEDNSYSFWGMPMAVWHETESLAWLFVGSYRDTHSGSDYTGNTYTNESFGSVYVYRLDWTTEPPTLTQPATLFMEGQDACNGWGNGCWPAFGTAVTISADGRVLAVSAFRANQTGAVYVYMRPDGEGQSWGDITQEDAIKVSSVAIPPWGASNSAGQRPFDSGASGRTGAATDCDAYCSRVQSWVGSEFGWRAIRLSGDGEVLAVGAIDKSYSELTPGGSFGGKTNVGQVAVFVAPGGDWEAAAQDARFDDQGNAKTLIGARESATAFDPATHYSPGPRLRVTRPTAKLSFGDWGSPATNAWFGSAVDVTLDGRTIAAGTGWDYATGSDPNLNNQRGRRIVQIFQLEAGQSWADVGAANPTGLNTWSAQYHKTAQQAEHGFPLGQLGFSADGAALLMGSPIGGIGGQDQGNAWLVQRPANGRWSGNISGPTASDWNRGGGRTFRETATGFGNASAGFGFIAQSPDRQLLALSALGEKALNKSTCSGCNAIAGSGPHSYLSNEQCATRPRERDGIVDLVTTCRVVLPDSSALVPVGMEPGTFQIIAALTDVQLGDDTDNALSSLTGTLELEIGAVEQLAEATLEFATNTRGTADTTDDTAWPTTIAAGESTALRLQILTERGKPADAASVSSLVASTSIGTLGSNLGAVPGCTGGAGAICRLDATALTNDNADNILLTLSHGGAAGAANVSVRVIGEEGETLRSNVVTVTLTGAPASLSIAAPAAGLLNVGTSDSGADKDDRDLLTLSVAAADQGGNRVDAPTTNLRTRLTGPDGKRVTSGVEVEWPLGGADNPTLDANRNRQVRVNVNRASAQPLANGEYTLEVRAGSLTATQTFTVSGGPASLSLGEIEGTLAEGEQISLTATVLDADGNPVPNDTPIEWSATDVGTTAVLVQLSADAKTTDGKASARWLVLSAGSTAVRAQAGDAADLRLLDVAAAMAAAVAAVEPPEPPNPVDGLVRPTPGFAAWFGEGATTASALLDGLPGVDSILFWHVNRWLRYARSNGQTVPGSVNFEVTNGSVLWLAE